MHKHARLGGSGGMLHQKIFRKIDALRLLPRPFWNRSRIIVATWLADNCIKFLAVHVHLLSQLTWIFYHRKYYITRKTTGELSSA